MVLLSELMSRFEREVSLGVATYARHHTNWQLHVEHDLNERQVLRWKPAGMLVMTSKQRVEHFASEHRIPLVVIASPPHLQTTLSVSVDEREVSRMAADYLIDLGLRNFAYVGHAHWPFVIERRDHFCSAIQERGYGPASVLVGQLYDRRRRARFERNLQAFVQSLPRPCGVLAANDAVGTEVIEICMNIGLRVPDDIAVLGVDDDELTCELSRIPLSSIVQPFLSIGYEGARLLDHQIARRPSARQLFLPPVKVRARASSDLIAIDDAEVAAALRLIRERFVEPINVEWLVRELSVARRSLERKFKKYVGRTVMEHIRHVRFQRANELLAESDLSLDTVAARSGFSNARWLSDSYRRVLHTTPNTYRKTFRIER